MRTILATLVLIPLLFPLSIDAQWAKSYGQSNGSYVPNSIRVAHDDGYILTGTFNLGSKYWDGWILKLSSQGDVEWMRSYCPLFDISVTTDGGYIASGDRHILKLDVLGNIEWYFSSREESYYSIQQTKNGGYILSGTTYTDDSPASFVLKLSADGTIEWNKMFAIGDKRGGIISIQEVPDNGYVAVGNTSFNKDGTMKFWIVKLDVLGNTEWQKKLGSETGYSAQDLKVSEDGSFIIIGNVNPFLPGEKDIFVAKFQPNGSIEWQKSFVGLESDSSRSVEVLGEHEYIIVGYTYINKSSHCLILKLSATGNLEWQRTFGGGENISNRPYAQAYSICQIGDGDYTVTGNEKHLGESPETPTNYPPQNILVFKFSHSNDYQTCSFFGTSYIPEADLSLVSQELTFRLRNFEIKQRDWEYEPWADFETIEVNSLCPQTIPKHIKKGSVKR